MNTTKKHWIKSRRKDDFGTIKIQKFREEKNNCMQTEVYTLGEKNYQNFQETLCNLHDACINNKKADHRG